MARAAGAVSEARARIAAQHAAGVQGWAVCVLASDHFDSIVRGLWTAILADLSAADAARLERHAALVAHGGFGRREMAPWSDIDLMILHDGRARPLVADAAKRLLQDLFDAGLDAGQSVRTVTEALTLAAGDATIMSSLLDCRLLEGNGDLVQRLGQRLRAAISRGRRRHIDRLVAARREEADKFGQTVALLEPNVKRSPGGLRDIQLLRWLGRLAYGAETLGDLALAGGIRRADADAVRDAREFLMQVRNDLHLAAGKPADELTRDQQVRIAAARGVESRDGLLGVERFMREYVGHTRRVAQVVDSVVRSLRRPGPVKSLATGLLGHAVDGTFRVGPLDVAVVPARLPDVAGSVCQIVRLVELSMLYDMPVAQEAREAVRAGVAALPRDPDPAANASFLRLFSHPARLAGGLRWLHEMGVLEILIPQFAPCPQPAAVQQLPQVHRRRALHPGRRTGGGAGRRARLARRRVARLEPQAAVAPGAARARHRQGISRGSQHARRADRTGRRRPARPARRRGRDRGVSGAQAPRHGAPRVSPRHRRRHHRRGFRQRRGLARGVADARPPDRGRRVGRGAGDVDEMEGGPARRPLLQDAGPARRRGAERRRRPHPARPRAAARQPRRRRAGGADGAGSALVVSRCHAARTDRRGTRQARPVAATGRVRDGPLAARHIDRRRDRRHAGGGEGGHLPPRHGQPHEPAARDPRRRHPHVHRRPRDRPFHGGRSGLRGTAALRQARRHRGIDPQRDPRRPAPRFRAAVESVRAAGSSGRGAGRPRHVRQREFAARHRPRGVRPRLRRDSCTASPRRCSTRGCRSGRRRSAPISTTSSTPSTSPQPTAPR